MASVSLAIVVARLGLVEKAVRLAAENAGDASGIRLMLYGNGVSAAALREAVGPALKPWRKVVVLESETNRGAPHGLHALWEAARADGVRGEDDLLVYTHDDLFIMGKGWETAVTRVFDADPRCALAGFSGAPGLGLDELYHTPYRMEQMIRLGFMSNLPSAEAHGVRCLEPKRISLTDGCSMIMRRSFLDSVNGWSWWPFVDHNYEVGVACEVARARLHAWYIPVVHDHLSGWTANNAEGVRMFSAHGGQVALQHESARYLYDHYRDVLPLRVR